MMIASFAFAIFSCNNQSEQKDSADVQKKEAVIELQTGDQLNGLTVKSITKENGYYLIEFTGEKIIEGKLKHFSDWGTSVKTILIDQKVIINEDTVNFSVHNQVKLRNDDPVAKLIPHDWTHKSMQGAVHLSDPYQGELPVKMKISNLKFAYGEITFSAKMDEILLIDGKTPEEFKKAHQPETNVLNFNEIKNGDVICGLTVEKKSYKRGEYFSIDFSGEYTASGVIVKNPMDASMDFFIDENDVPNAKIKIENYELPLFKTLYSYKTAELKKGLSNEQLSKLNNGQRVPVNITAKNISAGTHFEKGRREAAQADFVKLN